LIGAQRAPWRSKRRLLRQAVINQHLKLLRFKGLGKCVGLCFGPPLKPSFGKTSDDQPPSNAVERQDFESRAAAIAKDEKGSVIKLGVELSAAQADQPIDAFAEIDGLTSEQDVQLRQ